VALEIISRVVKKSLKVADPPVYSELLEAYFVLLPKGEQQNAGFETVFRLCAESGRIDNAFLHQLLRLCPKSLYHRLTNLDPSQRPDMSSMPFGWRRNVMDRQRKRGRDLNV
jgi:hypothetical protein